MRIVFRLLALIAVLSCVGGGVCHGQDIASKNNIVNERRAVDEKAAFDERSPIDERYVIDSVIYTRDIYQRFGEYVDDVYVVGFRPESYIDAHILITNYDIEIDKLLGNIAIGTGVIIVTAIVMPALLPALSPNLAVIVTQFPKVGTLVRAGLANAAIGAGINGTVSYIKSGGDLDATLSGTLTGAGEGFKWGVIAVAGADLASVAVRLGKTGFIRTRNWELAGKSHPQTGVPFTEELVATAQGQFFKAVLPQFKSKFNFPMVKLPESLYLASRDQHFKYCNNYLKEYIERYPGFANHFTQRQLEQIRYGAIKIDGLTWHHTGTQGQMQLVDTLEHEITGHTGGFAIWGQGGLK